MKVKILMFVMFVASHAHCIDCLDLQGQKESLERRQNELVVEAERLGQESNRLEQRSSAKEENLNLIQDIVAQSKQLRDRLDDTSVQIQRFCRKK